MSQADNTNDDQDGVKTGNLEVDEDTMLVLKRKGDRFYVYVLSLAIQHSPEMWGVWLHDMIGILADAYHKLGNEDREEVVTSIMRELAIEVASARAEEMEDAPDQEFN